MFLSVCAELIYLIDCFATPRPVTTFINLSTVEFSICFHERLFHCRTVLQATLVQKVVCIWVPVCDVNVMDMLKHATQRQVSAL